MPRNRGPMYGGAYEDVTAAKLANIDLPERLHCKNCGVDKPISQYSKRQTSNLRYNIFRYHNRNTPGAGDRSILCRACTPQVNNELLCIMCDHVKDLASFAKNHRSNPERAVCKECMYVQQMNDQPGLEDYSEGSDDDEEKSNLHESDDDLASESGATLPLTLDNLHLTQVQEEFPSYALAKHRKPNSSRMTVTSRSPGGSTTGDIFGNEASIEDDLRSNASTVGGVVIGSNNTALGSKASTTGHDDDVASTTSRWQLMRTIGYREGKVAESITPTHSEKGKGKAFMGYDPHGAPHQRYRSESVTSERSGSISYTSRDRFPKVRSAFPDAKSTGTRNHLPSRDDFPESTGYHVGYDDDDDDSEGEMVI